MDNNGVAETREEMIKNTTTPDLMGILFSLQTHKGHGCLYDNPEEMRDVRRELTHRGIRVSINKERFDEAEGNRLQKTQRAQA